MSLHEATKRLNIIYIHGFASIGNGEKSKFLQRYYEGTVTRVFAPDLPPNPTMAVETLIDLVKGLDKEEKVVAIGTSLGGFYSLYLNARLGIPAFAINPLVYASAIRRHIGTNKNLYTGETFEFKPEYVDAMIEMEKEIFKPNPKNINVYLAKNDETIPYEKTVERLPKEYPIHIYETGSHRFSIFPEIYRESMEPIIEKLL